MDEAAASISGVEFLSTADQWNIGRIPNTCFPPKDQAAHSVASPFRDGGIWANSIESPKIVHNRNSLRGHLSEKQKELKNKVELKPVQKEQWSEILYTGILYREATRVTRRTLPLWLEKIRLNPGLLVGPQTAKEDAQQWQHQDAVQKAKFAEQSGSSATASASAVGARQSRSPTAAGPRSPSSPSPTSQTTVGDISHVSRKPVVMSITLQQKEAKSGDPLGMWGDTDSAAGLEVDQASATVWSLDLNTGVNTEAKSKSASRASSESEWEVLPKKRNRSKAGSAASCSSKASRVSSLMESVSGLRKRQSPP